jgi:hypothetical protein
MLTSERPPVITVLVVLQNKLLLHYLDGLKGQSVRKHQDSIIIDGVILLLQVYLLLISVDCDLNCTKFICTFLAFVALLTWG